MARLTRFLCLLPCLLVAVSAYQHKSASFLQAGQTLESGTSCFYNMFLANYDGTGFGGASISVTVNGVEVDDLQNATIPSRLYESGFVVPVQAGQVIAATYSKGSSTTLSNKVWFTDANGQTVFSRTFSDSDETVSFSLDAAACECFYQTIGCGTRVRNEWRSLPYCQQKLYIAAIQEFRAKVDTSGQNLYDQYAVHHNVISGTVARRALFLPWHRAFIYDFENNLRAMGGNYSCLALPYWDWSLDFGAQHESTVYGDFGGLRESSCLEAPFDWWYNPVLKECVYRRRFIKEQPFDPAFASNAEVDLAITGNNTYHYIFLFLVRGPHKAAHTFVGGSNGTMGMLSSPADPLFWLHHANLDRVYAAWQDCWDYDMADSASAQFEDWSGCSCSGLDTDMPLIRTGLARTPRSVFDINELGYRYPPIFETLPRLNGANSLPSSSSSTKTCNWNWFSASQQESESITHVPNVHTARMRTVLSHTRETYHTELTRQQDFYGAVVSKLRAECDTADHHYNENYPHMFADGADITPLIGPSEMFKNTCQLLDNGNFTKIFWL